MVAPTPTPQVLLDGAIARISLWLETLESDLASSTASHRERQEFGAVGFLGFLADRLANYRRAFELYRRRTTAPVMMRLQWLQHVGAGLAELEYLFGRLSVPVAATLTPLLAAYSRLLDKLAPGCPPSFRPVRDFNYEVEEFHSDYFPDLPRSVMKKHNWPLLFITLPTGLLDSPRSHILVGHEIGHAIAAIHREKLVSNRRDREDAKSKGLPLPAPVPAFLPEPHLQQAEILKIARQRWLETGLPPPQQIGRGGKPNVDTARLLEMVAAVGAEADELTQAWLEELFGDAIGTALFGPAFLVSFLDVLMTTGSMERGSSSHPSLALRLRCIGATLNHAAVGFKAEGLPSVLRGRFEAAISESDAALNRTKVTAGSEALLHAAVEDLLKNVMDEIVNAAVEYVKSHNALYTSSMFEADITEYVDDFTQAGVPPIGKDLPLATVFNVGQVMCTDHLNAFCPGLDDREKERRVDDLLLKAIELNEIALAWSEA